MAKQVRRWLILAAAWWVCNSVLSAAEPRVASQLPPGKQWKLVWWTEGGAVLDGQGHLLLKAYAKNGQYYSSTLQTGSNYLDRPGQHYSPKLVWPVGKLQPAKFLHKYGYYEIRCQLPKQPGYWAAFWLQSPVIGCSLDPRTAGVEIDIMENFQRDGGVRHAAIWNGYGPDRRSKSTKDKAGKDRPQPALKEGFHTFGVDWSRTGYVYYVDGRESWRFNDVVSDREQFILVSTECKGYRRGGPDPELKQAKLPDAFVVDYVRVFDEVVSPRQ